MRYIALFLLLISFTSSAKPIPVDAYAQLPNKSLFAISPSGDKLAYRDTGNKKDILVVVDSTTNKLISAININKLNPNLIYFVSEQTVVIVATKNIKLGGFRGRYDASWAYAINLENNEIHPLLQQGYGIYKGQTQLGRILGVSKDKNYAYMPAYQTPGQYNLYKVNLKKKRRPKLMQKGTSDTDDFFVNESGDVIARERFNNQSNLHRVEARINDEWVEIYNLNTEIKQIGIHGLTPDYQALVISALNLETQHLAYYTMKLSNGEIGTPIFENKNKSVERLLMDVNRVVYGAQYSGFTPSYEFFDEKLNARMRGVLQALPNNTFTIKDYTPDWEQIVFFMEGEFSSGDFIKYNAGGLEMIASSRPQVPPAEVRDVVEYIFKARDGLKIPTLLTLPEQSKTGPAPTIMMPHGGPESYDRKGFNYMAQYFANQGYLVVQPQFRGSSGFGVDFISKGRGEWGIKMQHDLSDAITSLVKDGKVDKDRVCIVGTSYGGYAALAGAAFTPDLYQCAVSINGVSDLESMMKSVKWDHGRDHWVLAYWEDIIAKGNFQEDHLKIISPINSIKKVKAPILLIHSELDETVPLRQSRNMRDALEHHDKQVEFLELEKGDHYLSKAENRMKAMRAMSKFVKKHI